MLDIEKLMAYAPGEKFPYTDLSLHVLYLLSATKDDCYFPAAFVSITTHVVLQGYLSKDRNTYAATPRLLEFYGADP